MKKKRHPFVWRILLCMFIILIASTLTFMHFGGFNTGTSADFEEFAAYAKDMENISIPANARIIALGEITRGNAEVQKLKTDIFNALAEDCGVRAFAVEGRIQRL